MFQRILVPLDGSALAERALEYGADAASRYGARITLLRAYDGPQRTTQLLLRMPPVAGVPTAYPWMVEQAAAAGQDVGAEIETYLAEHQQALAGRGLAVDTLAVDADAAEAILEEARREPDTLIVMSTHGRGGLGRLVFGSVAHAVLQRSPVPLLLIRAGMPEPEPEATE